MTCPKKIYRLESFFTKKKIMEGFREKKRLKPNKRRQPCLLNLNLFLPIRDLRKMIWKKLTKFDMKMIWIAHGTKKYSFSAKEFAVSCAKHGYVNLLKSTLLQTQNTEMLNTCLCAALKKGQINVVEYFMKQNYRKLVRPFDFHFAACKGHVKILELLKNHGHKWIKETCWYISKNPETLKWAIKNGCEWDTATFHWGIQRGHLESLKWAIDNECPTPDGPEYCKSALYKTKYEVFKWLTQQGFPFDATNITIDTIEEDDVRILKLVIQLGCRYDKKELLRIATIRNFPNIMKYLKSSKN